MTEEERIRLENEGWTIFEDEDGVNIWGVDGVSDNDVIINVDALEVWGYTGWQGRSRGNRSYDHNYNLLAGPFDTLEAAQAAYLLLDESTIKE